MIYDYTITTGRGGQLDLADYRGKVIMVVNTATGCGFTPQYEPIEQMYRDHHDQGLEIIDIPCNQFGAQAPGTDDEIHEFCTVHYNTTFPPDEEGGRQRRERTAAVHLPEVTEGL